MALEDIGAKIGLDVSEFKNGITEINRQTRVIESEFKAVAASMDNWQKSSEGLEARQKALAQIIEGQKSKVESIKQVYEAVAQAEGEGSKGAQELAIKLNKATEELNKYEAELRKNDAALADFGDGAEEAAKDTDKLGDELNETESKASKFGDVMKTVGSGLKDAVVVGAKAAAAGVLALTGVLVAGGKEIVQQFGELEQNLGGSEAVFGEYAASIQKTGEEAYKNLGVSQSEYLATANKMGALFQGSGVEQVKSLELTEKAMQRAADMASVMGIDMQMALDSVTGAAKGNFTMMDNLGVSMNATNIEAYALAKGLDFTWKTATQAEKAEVAMQMFFENTEQYAGNFAKESTQTISGSIGLLQAALGSFTAGLGNANADMTNLTQNLVDAFQAVVQNIVPVLGNVVSALPTALSAILTALGTVVQETFSGLITEIGAGLPGVISMITDIITELVSTVATLLPTLLPPLLDGALALLTGVLDAIAQNAEQLGTLAADLVTQFVGFIAEALPDVIQAGLDIVLSLIDGLTEAIPELLPVAMEAVMEIIEGIVEALPKIIDTGVKLIVALVDGLVKSIPKLLEKAPEIISKLATAIVQAIPKLVDTAVQLITKLAEFIVTNLPKIIETGIKIITELIVGLVKAIPQLIAAIPQLISAIAEAFMNTDWLKVGGDIIAGIGKGIRDGASAIGNAAKEAALGAFESAKRALGINSPSRLFADGIGAHIPSGVALGVRQNVKTAISAVKDMAKGLPEAVKVDIPKIDIPVGFDDPDFPKNPRNPRGAGGAMMEPAPSSNNSETTIQINVNINGGDVPAQEKAKDFSREIARQTARQLRLRGVLVPG